MYIKFVHAILNTFWLRLRMKQGIKNKEPSNSKLAWNFLAFFVKKIYNIVALQRIIDSIGCVTLFGGRLKCNSGKCIDLLSIDGAAYVIYSFATS